MPQTVELRVYRNRDYKHMPVHVDTKCLTEAELLAFANKVREAGGAEVIPALLPSVKCEPEACLIATSLNFSSEITTNPHTDDDEHDPYWPNGTMKWVMYPGLSKEKTLELANKLGLGSDGYQIDLPELVGNCAAAFDEGVAFEKYA